MSSTSTLDVKLGSSKEVLAFVDTDCAKFSDRGRGRTILQDAKNVGLSTTQVEHVAIGDVVKEALLVSAVLKFTQPHVEKKRKPLRVYEDNQGGTPYVNISESFHNSAHTDVRHHIFRELVAKQVVRVVHSPSAQQRAATFTTRLPVESFRSTGML